jgi:hypothetical protein
VGESCLAVLGGRGTREGRLESSSDGSNVISKHCELDIGHPAYTHGRLKNGPLPADYEVPYRSSSLDSAVPHPEGLWERRWRDNHR